MRIVEVWTLKEGILDPPRPLDPEYSAWILRLWGLQDTPIQQEFHPKQVCQEILDLPDDYGTHDLVFL